MEACHREPGMLCVHDDAAERSWAICGPWRGILRAGWEVKLDSIWGNGFPVEKTYYARPPDAPEGDG